MAWVSLFLLVCAVVLAMSMETSASQKAGTGISVGDTALTAIRYPAGASETVKFAASELAEYLEKATGAKLSVAEGKPRPGVMYVSAVMLKSLRTGFRKSGYDRALLKSKDGCIYLIGENDRSALYAVYDFLQDFIKIEFFAPGETHEYIPPVKHIELPATLSSKYGSEFEIRDYYAPYGWIDTIDFVAKNRLNSIIINGVEKTLHKAYIAEIHKRGMTLRGPGHNWSNFLPDASLFDTHPEYFPVIDGKRAVNGRTACLSNPKVVEIFLDKWRAYVHEHRGFWDTITLWPEDVADEHYCGCPECIKEPNANWYIMLATKAATIVEEEAPEARFEFIAYHSLRNAPTVKVKFPSDGRNMLFDLCLGYDRDSYEPINADVKYNQTIVSMMDKWKSYLDSCGFKGKTIIMDYYNLCEVPDIGPRSRAYLWPVDVIQKDCQYYKQRGLDGVGDWVCASVVSFPTPFVVWSWTKVWTDTNVDLAKLENRFYPVYFGTAGNQVKDYIHRLTALMHEKAKSIDDPSITGIEDLAKSLDNIDTSQLSDTIRHRIQVLKVHAEYCLLLKKAFVSMATGDPEKWAPYEKQLKAFFIETHKDVLKNDMDIPPAFINVWWDFADRDPASAKSFAEIPTAH